MSLGADPDDPESVAVPAVFPQHGGAVIVVGTAGADDDPALDLRQVLVTEYYDI